MSVINHVITNNGLSITVNENKGSDNRNFQYVHQNITVKTIHRGEYIDDQNQVFEILGVQTKSDASGNLLSSIGFNKNEDKDVYNQFYGIIESIPAVEAIHRRAINGLLAKEFGTGFCAFNPVDNLAPFQCVEFDLSVSTAPTEGASDGVIACNHTDGSGSYDYSLDGGITWGLVGLLTGLSAGDYSVSIRDTGVTNAWFRTKKITLSID